MHRGLIVVQECRFRYFKLESFGAQSGHGERIDHILHDIAGAELNCRQIDRETYWFWPLSGGVACLAQNPVTERRYQADFFREGNEIRRGDHTPFWMVPAKQRFQPADAA